jgi:hypothetical protein
MHRLNGASGSADFSVIIIVKLRNQLRPSFRTIRASRAISQDVSDALCALPGARIRLGVPAAECYSRAIQKAAS